MVGDNSESKSLSSETNKTTSTSSTSLSKTKQQSSTSGGMNSFTDNLVEPIILRKRRNTFNQHDSHQLVVPSKSKIAFGRSDVQFEQLTDLHGNYLDKVVHDNAGRFTKVNKFNKSKEHSMMNEKLKATNKISRRSIVYQNILSNTFTNSSHNNFFNSPTPSTTFNLSLHTLQDHKKLSSAKVVTAASTVSPNIKINDDLKRKFFLQNMFTKKIDIEEYKNQHLKIEKVESDETESAPLNDIYVKTNHSAITNSIVKDILLNDIMLNDHTSTATESLNFTIKSDNQLNSEYSLESERKTDANSFSNSSRNKNNLTKEYNIPHHVIPQPRYDIEQEEIEIIKLQEETTIKNKDNDRKIIPTIKRNESNEKFVYNYKKIHNKFPSADLLVKQNQNSLLTGKKLKNELPSNITSFNSSINNQNNVFYPSVSFSSPQKMVVNVAISIEDKPEFSSILKPVFALSLSMPTVNDTNYLIPNIEISHNLPEQLITRDATREIINHDEKKLTTPLKINTSSPPIWAGGECECSCPCMDNNDDDLILQNSSSTLIAYKNLDQSYTKQTDLNTTTDQLHSSDSSSEETSSTHVFLESTSEINCLGNPLPLEPTILILEGKMWIYLNIVIRVSLKHFSLLMLEFFAD